MVQEASGGKAALICGSVAYDTILVFPETSFTVVPWTLALIDGN
jgi:hypothetical protein